MKQAIKVLMLNYEFPPLGGGAANANYYLLKELSKEKNISVDLVTSHNNLKVSIKNFASQIKIHFLPVKKEQLHYWKQAEVLSYSWQAYNYIKSLIKANNFHLAHAFFALPCGWLASRFRPNLPYLVSLRGSDVPGFNQRLHSLNWFLQPLFRQVLNQAAAVTANSDDLKNLALKTWPGMIEVIPNGVDTNQFKPSKHLAADKQQAVDNNGLFKLLTVSRLIQRKNIALLIKALALLTTDNWELQVIGTGKQENELRQLAKSLGVAKKVKFLGYVPHDKLPFYYNQADLFALPSENEGMSNALLEAMACGLPVFVKDTGAASQLVKGNGVVFKEADATLMAKLLEGLIADRNKLQQMAKESWCLAKNYSWQQVANRYVELYNEIVKKDYYSRSRKQVYAQNHKEKLTQPTHYLHSAHTFVPELITAFTKTVPQGSQVLEIGCGGGHATAKLAALGYKVTAIDISPVAVAEAKAKYGHMAVFQDGDATRLAFSDGSFQAVVSVELIEHLADVEAHLQEVKRVLKAGGCYFIKTPNRLLHNIYYFRHKKIKFFHPSVMTPGELKRKAQEHGFTVQFLKLKRLPPYQVKKVQKIKVFGLLLTPLAALFPLNLLPISLQPSIICLAVKTGRQASSKKVYYQEVKGG